MRFIEPEIEDGSGYPIEIRQLEMIKIRQPNATTQSLNRQGVSDDMAHTEPRDTDRHRTEPGLFLSGDVISVAIQAAESWNPSGPRTATTARRHG